MCGENMVGLSWGWPELGNYSIFEHHYVSCMNCQHYYAIFSNKPWCPFPGLCVNKTNLLDLNCTFCIHFLSLQSLTSNSSLFWSNNICQYFTIFAAFKIHLVGFKISFPQSVQSGAQEFVRIKGMKLVWHFLSS